MPAMRSPFSRLSRGASWVSVLQTWRIDVTQAPFDSAHEEQALRERAPGLGALASFLGIVRPEHEGLPLSALWLEHYPDMTQKQLEQLAMQASMRWPLLGGTLIHRYGRLAAGESIVLVQVAAQHRDSAFVATHFLMDWLKTKAPFWKQAELADGQRVWVQAKAQDDQAAKRWE
jgi:molybdopterin synthase catalytic subunit